MSLSGVALMKLIPGIFVTYTWQEWAIHSMMVTVMLSFSPKCNLFILILGQIWRHSLMMLHKNGKAREDRKSQWSLAFNRQESNNLFFYWNYSCFNHLVKVVITSFRQFSLKKKKKKLKTIATTLFLTPHIVFLQLLHLRLHNQPHRYH